VPLVGEQAIMGLVASFSFVALIIGLFVKARLAASEAAQ